MKNQILTPPYAYKLLLLLGIFAITLSACSSGGGDSDNGSSNSAPSVSAGEDQTVNQGATVNLTGVASDSDGSISSWLWQQTSGSPSVTIKNSTTSNASFAAPEVEAETTLVFELEVKDNDGASVSDSMRVTVRGPGDSVNPLPDDFKAEAGDTQVTLSWSHYSSATDYNIYRSSASDCELANYTSCANGALFTSKSSPFTDTGLTNGTTYHYWIEAILEGFTYLDGEAISAMPAADEDDDNGFNINEDDYQTIYTHSDGTIYAVTKETMNWDDARDMAQAQGGDLVTIHSEEENELVADLLDGEAAWLGGSDDGDRIPGAFETVASSSENGWRWVDGSEFIYVNWHGTNEPNDSGAEDCVQMNYASHTEESWNDKNCSYDLYAVFEFSPSTNTGSAWQSHGGGDLNHKSSNYAYGGQSIDDFEILWEKSLGSSSVYPVSGDTDGDGINDLIALADDTVYTIDRDGDSTQFDVQHGNSLYLMLSDINDDNAADIFVGSADDDDKVTVGIYLGAGSLVNNLVRSSGYDSSVHPVSYIDENKLIVRYSSGYSRDPRGVGLWDLSSGEETFYFDIGPVTGAHGGIGLSVLDANNDGLLEIVMNSFTPHNGASGSGSNGNGSSTSDGDLYTIVINEEGEELLSQKIGEDTSGGANGRAEHKFADIDNDGNYEIIATVAHEGSYYTGDAQIRILELDGSERDRVSVGDNAYQIGMVISDINGDSYSEIIIRDEAEDTIEIYSHELELVKKVSVAGSSDDRIWTHSASDIDGDGTQEMLVSVEEVLYIYSGMDLQLLDQFTLSTQIIYAFATDLNGDDLAEVVAATNSGDLYLIGSPD